MNRRSRKLSRRAAARLAAQQGMTLIEIMIVVIIMAMIATGVAVAVMPQLKKARIKEARVDCGAIRTAVQLYMAESPGSCPSVEDLKNESYLDKGKRTVDPWGKDFVINCTDGEDPEVYSLGPDNSEGGCDPGRTADDGCDGE